LRSAAEIRLTESRHISTTTDARHWHYVSYGMSELYDKASEDKDVSGWGFEFTFRLNRENPSEEPPLWPLSLMQNLARYVVKTGNVFAAGHSLPLNGPIALETGTALHAAMFIEDPELQTIETPHGKLQFLLLVGATLDELAAARAWDSERLLAMMRPTNPFLVTDLARQSILADSTVAQTVAEETAREGSSSASLAVRELSFEIGSGSLPKEKHLTLLLGASAVGDFRALLRGRTAFGRDFHVVGPDAILRVVPAENFDCTHTKNHLEMGLSSNAAKALADVLHPTRGDYQVSGLPFLTVRVVPSEIRDHTGTKVVEVIG
jgi:suppressor of fused